MLKLRGHLTPSINYRYIEFEGVSRRGSVWRSITWTHLDEKISNILPPFCVPYTQPCNAKILKLVGHIANDSAYMWQEVQTFTIRGSSHTNWSKLPHIYGINSGNLPNLPIKLLVLRQIVTKKGQIRDVETS